MDSSNKYSINYCLYYLINDLSDNDFDENFEDNLLNELNKELIKQGKHQFVYDDYYMTYGRLIRDALKDEQLKKLKEITTSFSGRSDIFVQLEKQAIKTIKGLEGRKTQQSVFARPIRINDNMRNFMLEFLDEIGLKLSCLRNGITSCGMLTRLFTIYSHYAKLKVDTIHLHSSDLMDKYFSEIYTIKNINKNKFIYARFQCIISFCKLNFLTEEEISEKDRKELDKEHKFMSYFWNIFRDSNDNLKTKIKK